MERRGPSGAQRPAAARPRPRAVQCKKKFIRCWDLASVGPDTVIKVHQTDRPTILTSSHPGPWPEPLRVRSRFGEVARRIPLTLPTELQHSMPRHCSRVCRTLAARVIANSTNDCAMRSLASHLLLRPQPFAVRIHHTSDADRYTRCTHHGRCFAIARAAAVAAAVAVAKMIHRIDT